MDKQEFIEQYKHEEMECLLRMNKPRGCDYCCYKGKDNCKLNIIYDTIIAPIVAENERLKEDYMTLSASYEGYCHGATADISLLKAENEKLKLSEKIIKNGINEIRKERWEEVERERDTYKRALELACESRKKMLEKNQIYTCSVELAVDGFYKQAQEEK